MKREMAWGVMIVSCLASFAVVAQEEPARKELRRADLTGAPGMEVVLSITEIKPGEQITAHIHHGMETGYVLEGALVQYAGNAPVELATGASIWNLRDVAHGGFKVVGTRTLKLVTVHIVDKGKPLYDWTAK
jgi:quercetin dioxygenase-like cupin family protein